MDFSNAINNIVDEISIEVANAKLDLPDSSINIHTKILILANRINTKNCIAMFNDFFGKSKIDSFFNDSKITLESQLSHLLSLSMCPTGSGFHLEKDIFQKNIQDLGKMLADGYAQYQITYRILNVVIPDTLTLEETDTKKIFFRMIPDSEVKQKYRTDELVRPIFLPHWSKHRLEAVFQLKGLPKDIERDISLTVCDHNAKLITNTLILSSVANNSLPYATHQNLISTFRNVSCSLGFGDFSVDPKMLSHTDMERVAQAFRIVKAAEHDNVLHRAIDRFVIGIKQYSHHPNKINIPNWDKVVDYAIAFETLLLTTPDKSSREELSYRFKLNGTSLLSKLIDIDKRTLFKSLSEIYNLRSRIVHGSDSKDVVKSGKKYIELLRISQEQDITEFEIFRLVCDQLEQWLVLIFEYMAGIDIEERPYKKPGGWEDLLWQ